MPKSKYFKVLGLPSSASEKEIKKRYRTLVMKYHPDRNNDPNAHELFMRVTEAYEIVLNPSFIPKNIPRSQKTDDDKKKEREERMKKARERFKQQEEQEKAENIRFYNSITNGARWKRFRLLSIVGAILAFILILDLILPHHRTEDQLESYSINVARSPDGGMVGAIYTQKDNIHFVKNLDYELFGNTRYIEIESSWILHSPIYLMAKQKTKHKYYRLSFTVYGATILLVILFLIPLFTYWYKRMNILFTILFYISYYGITGLSILFLILGNRMYHLITLGFY